MSGTVYQEAPESEAGKEPDFYPGKAFIGWMGGPGTGKTVAFMIGMNPGNVAYTSATLGAAEPLQVAVAKKWTERPGRAEDIYKVPNLPREAFDDPGVVGAYILPNNNSMYAYHVSEFQKPGQIMLMEPSVHHLPEVRAHLGQAMFTTLLVSEPGYRRQRLDGRGTEDPLQVTKRVWEGDFQVFYIDRLVGGLKAPDGSAVDIEGLIDPSLYRTLLTIEGQIKSGDASSVDNVLFDFLMGAVNDEVYAVGAVREYGAKIRTAAEAKANPKLVNRVIALDETYLHPDFENQGKYRDSVLGITVDFARSRAVGGV